MVSFSSIKLAGLQDGENDSWLELKDNQSDNDVIERRRRVGAVHILQIQDEIDYILSNLEHIVEPHVVSVTLHDILNRLSPAMGNTGRSFRHFCG